MKLAAKRGDKVKDDPQAARLSRALIQGGVIGDQQTVVAVVKSNVGRICPRLRHQERTKKKEEKGKKKVKGPRRDFSS